MSRIHIPTEWDYCISIPLEDLQLYMTEEEYKKNKDKFLSVNLTLIYENSVGDKEVGLEPSFDFVDWHSSVSYPESVVDAIDKRLKEYEQFYSDKAYEKLCDYIDYQKYGDY